MRPTRARSLRALAIAFGLLGPVTAVVPAEAATSTVSISASAATVDLGQAVTLSASVGGDAGCLAGRTVSLRWDPAGDAAGTEVGRAVTGADGSASFEQVQPHSGSYLAELSDSGSCSGATSAEVPVAVRVRVDASLVLGPGVAGSCVSLVTSVEPARPGQLVDVQRRRQGAWTTLEQLTLGPDSFAISSPCFGFDDVGMVRLRVRWDEQDALNATGTSTVLAFRIVEAPWMAAIDGAIGNRSISVSVGEDDAILYRHDDATPRIPASNTKLLLSMALLDAFGPGLRLPTAAAAEAIEPTGTVDDLWILGQGDPGVSRATVASLARALADAGLTRVRGRVLGSTGYFARDWNAPGWNEVARDYVNRPTALTFGGNRVTMPERRAAQVLTNRLRALGVRVRGEAGSGSPPPELHPIASVRSPTLAVMLRRTLRPSDNFAAEVLGKRLGVQASGEPGTIAKGAAAIEAFADRPGVDVTIHDSSGLSYANRVTADGMIRLLWAAEDASWLETLRGALPTGGQGTLSHRLHGVAVRAKTGSLARVSALSGWVYSDATGGWIEFSILSSGMAKSVAAGIEDRIVRILADDLDQPNPAARSTSLAASSTAGT